jgi:hypothetical protein
MEDIVIKDFQLGVGESPETGFGNMVNIDISSIKGIARIQQTTSQVSYSGTAVVDTIQWIVDGAISPQSVFALGDTQKVYKSSGGTSSWEMITGNNGGFGTGLAFWKNYLFVFRTTTIDVLASPYTSANWTLSWPGTNIGSDSYWHPAFVGQDDILYFGCGRYLGAIQEVAGTTFDPATSTTYTIQYGTSTSSALDLPQDYKIKCICELGSNLLLGTYKGTAIYDYTVGDIFPWDRISDSFDLPIRTGEAGIHQMININNTVYFAAGIYGRYFMTNGSSITEAFRIPQSSTGITSGYLNPYPGAMIQFNDKILFNVSAGSGINNLGVWSYNLKTGAILLENTISTGGSGGSNGVLIGALKTTGTNSYFIGWSEGGSTFGIDLCSLYNGRKTNYSAYIESQYIPIGSKTNPVPLSEIEFTLVKPLTTGQGVKIKYRTNLSDSFTTLGTYDFATYGGITGYTDTFNITADGGIQVRCELTTGSNSTTTPELREIKIR